MKWANVNPGEFRQQISWQQKTISSQNSFGEDQYGWLNFLSIPGYLLAKVERLSGRELQAAQQRWAEAEYRVDHFFVPGLTTEMRIAWYDNGTTRYLDVLDVGDRSGNQMITTAIAKEWTY